MYKDEKGLWQFKGVFDLAIQIIFPLPHNIIS